MEPTSTSSVRVAARFFLRLATEQGPYRRQLPVERTFWPRFSAATLGPRARIVRPRNSLHSAPAGASEFTDDGERRTIAVNSLRGSSMRNPLERNSGAAMEKSEFYRDAYKGFPGP